MINSCPHLVKRCFLQTGPGLHTYNKKDRISKLDKYNAALHLQMSHKFINIVHRIFIQGQMADGTFFSVK